MSENKLQNVHWWYGEYEFSEDVVKLYYGMPGTGIFKLLLDQYIQETQSENAKVLKDMNYSNSYLYGWRDFKYAYGLEFENLERMLTWKKIRADFKMWMENSYDIHCVYTIDTEHETDREIDDSWKLMNKMLNDIPYERGFLKNT